MTNVIIGFGIIGFGIGVISEFVVLIVIANIAKQVQKRRSKKIIVNGNRNSVKYEYTRGAGK